ncbi:MAG TPA: N-acetylmuramoyl-L-alanine amidase [Vicinamibacterales bacterium]|nr:N-acetylmuramoyl-L-alanine amidase [Vicinamibacterales bacterium]
MSAVPPGSEAQGQAGGLRVLTREGARTLATVSINNQEYVGLDEVANSFGLTLREDRLAGGVTATAGTQTVIITADQPVASVSGRLVSLSAAPVRQANRWFVPLDFLQRALGLALETRIELRRASRLLIVGDVRVPRVNARIEHAPASASVIFDITPATSTRVTMETDRLIVQFEADALELQLPAVPAQDFVQAVQPGDTPTIVRVIPGPRFALHRATTSQPDGSSSRLSIDMLPATTEAPTPPPATPAPSPTAPAVPLPMPVPSTGLRSVVIDPGHGGDEDGARGPGGALEKDITLQVARRLRTMIESRLGLRVFLTRDDDRTMSLDDRAAYANSQKADAFVSIHANAALRPAMRGAEVFYLSVDRADAESRRVSESSEVLPALGGGTRAIDLILWETAQARYLEQSSTLAGMVEQALRSRVEMSPRPVQQAPFRVLVGATMPAVLVEIGYLSNSEQEQALTSGAYQDQIAQGLFDAIMQFRAHVER